MCKHCDAKIKLRHCLGAILIVCGLVGCATEQEWNAAPWDKYECVYTDQGKEASYPCIDGRVQQWSDSERWEILKTKIKLAGHSTVSETLRVCKGAKACKLGDTYHTTNGDIAALVKLAHE